MFLFLNILVKYELFVFVCVIRTHAYGGRGLPYVLLFGTLPPCVLRQALLLLDLGLMRLCY